MPTYSYRCTECGTAFDVQQAFTDDALTECPTCSGKLRKLYGSVGVTFNGSGFYRNDSRASVKAGPEKKESSGSGDSGGSSGGSKDSSSSGSKESSAGSSSSSGSSSPGKASTP